MRSLKRAGNSPLHKAKPGLKLIALIVLITAVTINPITAIAGFALAAGLYRIAFPKAWVIAEQLWNLKFLLAIVVIPQLLLGTPWQTVAGNTLRLTDAILLATLFTLTTGTDELIETIESVVKSKTVSLAFAMAINAIPMVFKFAQQTREAQQARGVRPSATRMTIPLLVASLKYADDFAEALTARGVEV